TTNFSNDDIRVGLLTGLQQTGFYLVGDVRNHLHRASEVISATLFSDDFRIDFSRRDVGILVKVDVDETFVVSEVEIVIGPVFGDENFSVLIRTHCSRVNVQILIELLYRNAKSSVCQQSSQ